MCDGIEQTLQDVGFYSRLIKEKPPQEIKKRLDVVHKILKQHPFPKKDDHLFLQNMEGDKWLRLTKTTRLGRGKDNEIIITSHFASAHHCVIEQVKNRWVLKDSDSANGVYVNGKKIKTHILAHGDIVEIADTRFVFFSNSVVGSYNT